MKNLTILIILCVGFICHASPKPRDTIYTNVEALMKKIATTQNSTATYYLVLVDGDDKEVKVRIDLKQMDAEIPLFNSTEMDFKKLLALKEESLEEPLKKLEESKGELGEWKLVKTEVEVLENEIKGLKTGDSLAWDISSIDSIQTILDEKLLDKEIKYKKYDATFTEYEKMITDVLGDLKKQYTDRLSTVIEEAYHKLENTETVFLGVQDASTWHDVWINLIKLDARRPMKVNYVARGGKKVTENVSVSKVYYILHYAQIGVLFGDQVQPVIDHIKEKEIRLNPFLINERYALVCDDPDRTQDHINNVLDPWDYNFKQEFIDNNPLSYMELRKFSGGKAQEHVGKFGCVRYSVPSSCSHTDALYVIEGKNKAHMGIDLLAPINTTIYSVVNGTAYVYPGEISGYGKTISVKGRLKNLKTGKEEEIYVMYAHLNSISIENETEVIVGDVLGGTGITGNGNTSNKDERHLHLEILTQKWPSSSKGFSIRKPPLDYFKIINP